ncbi:DUF4145 domain-containing protein [Donghicola sp. C2-DW-16]|uniref:DUF4145 domain-containing protein n=1 Tax=Donghicola mangrovi TaxID=2729614 RepID=A0ABX2PDB2_9RHOB|nr:DUF4145 domain-containing protein [Donghicola mangrovi]NVO27121.1 DUF4145 domain-containing protein [Donghicola mangrovi]
MSNFSHNCPHCGTKKSGFRILANEILLKESYIGSGRTTQKQILACFCKCTTCSEVCIARFQIKDSTDFNQNFIEAALHNGSFARLFQVTSFIPQPESIAVIEGISERVRSSLENAEQCFVAKLAPPAGAMYRTALERATLELGCNPKDPLFKRIQSLSSSLPETLIKLLDNVRIFGNQSVHGNDDDPSLEDITRAREFALLFLTYTFELPEKIAAVEKRLSRD